MFNRFVSLSFLIKDTAMGKNINAQGEGENEYVKAVSR